MNKPIIKHWLKVSFGLGRIKCTKNVLPPLGLSTECIGIVFCLGKSSLLPLYPASLPPPPYPASRQFIKHESKVN